MEVLINGSGVQNLESALPDIGHLAKWSVSSCKYGFNVSCLRDNDPTTYWQSDGPQPHYVTLQFHKKVAIQRVAVHLNWALDDSYTPTKLLVRAGTGLHDLQDIKTVCMDQPSGWVQFDVGMEPAGDEENPTMKPLQAYVLELLVAANHQNGKDTHVRGLVVYGPKEQPYTDEDQIPFTNPLFKMHEFIR